MNEKIIEIKKIKGLAIVQLENGEKIRVPGALLRERPVKAGESIEPVLYREYIARRGYPHAIDRAVKLLAMRDHSEGELRDKLYQAGYPDSVIDRVIEKLVVMDLVDDVSFAEHWAESRAHRHGRRRIEQELTRKGVDREVARRAVGNLTDEDQLQDAMVGLSHLEPSVLDLIPEGRAFDFGHELFPSAIPVLHSLTHLPVIVDPSHGTGKSKLVKPMALAATAAGADGLIIEVHNDPKNALCDGAQSLTPEAFDEMAGSIRAILPYAAREIRE